MTRSATQILSIPERMGRAIMELLNDLTLASGYQNTADVQQPSQAGNVMRDRSLALTICDSEDVPDMAPGMADAYFQTYCLAFCVSVPANAKPTPDEQLAGFEAEIIRKLKTSFDEQGTDDRGSRFGGLGQELYVGGRPDKRRPGESLLIANLPGRSIYFDVLYFTERNDPTRSLGEPA